ncbi:MAG: FeoA domain-containing protein [bacterium]
MISVSLIGLTCILVLLILLAMKIVNKINISTKEKTEDIIKFLYKQSEDNQKTNLETIFLFSKISPKKLINIIQNLFREKIIEYDQENITLTSKGKYIAGQIIQKHRNIEKYLFENTSTVVEEIHKIAEKEEHKEFNKEDNTYDCVDPHGDIIVGEKPICYTLSSIQTNLIYKIIHIEDEPEEIYKKIVDLDLAPFDYIKTLQISSEYIKILTNKGQIIKLDPILFSNIYVCQEQDAEIQKFFEEIEQNISNITTLDKLKINEKAKIIGISFYIRGEQKRRLLELGISRNSIIQPVYNNMLGDDPRVYKIRNTLLALRKEQSKKIYVQKI